MDSLFSQKTLEFLFENRLHDSRTWFAEHKKEYQALVIQPMRQLVMDLSPTMLELDPQFITEPKVDKTIARIWRDTRYTKDPSLYRDHLWLIFKRGGRMHAQDYPGIYFEINQDGFGYGCGFYHASASYMNNLRQRILAGDETFANAQKAYLGQSVFQMDGDCFKRPRYSARTPEEQLWLERRNIGFHAGSHDFPLLFSRELSGKLLEDLRLLFPVYRFLLAVAEETLRQETERELWQR
ncbi:MAG: DUF2461 domain-containing protein [Acutalibacter sp.]